MGIQLGYPCMNLACGVGTTHTLRLASVGDVEKVKGVVRKNMESLTAVLRFNARHGIPLFRIGSNFVPFASHRAFAYDWKAEHASELGRIGTLAKQTGQRLSIHPGQYVCPGSPTRATVEASVAELRYAAALMDLLGFPDGVVVLHVGGAYGDKGVAARRFVGALAGEADVLRHLALENDERVWNPGEVIEVAKDLCVPAIVDTLHHRLNPGELSLREAMERAAGTWRDGRRQKVHISSQDPSKNRGAHAYGIDAADFDELRRVVEGLDVDVMVESKGKEQSLRTMGYPSVPPAEGSGEGDE